MRNKTALAYISLLFAYLFIFTYKVQLSLYHCATCTSAKIIIVIVMRHKYSELLGAR